MPIDSASSSSFLFALRADQTARPATRLKYQKSRLSVGRRHLDSLSTYHLSLSLSLSDFDGDNFVGTSDIEHAVKLLTQNEMALDEIESIWEKASVYLTKRGPVILCTYTYAYAFPEFIRGY